MGGAAAAAMRWGSNPVHHNIMKIIMISLFMLVSSFMAGASVSMGVIKRVGVWGAGGGWL